MRYSLYHVRPRLVLTCHHSIKVEAMLPDHFNQLENALLNLMWARSSVLEGQQLCAAYCKMWALHIGFIMRTGKQGSCGREADLISD